MGNAGLFGVGCPTLEVPIVPFAVLVGPLSPAAGSILLFMLPGSIGLLPAAGCPTVGFFVGSGLEAGGSCLPILFFLLSGGRSPLT